MLNIVKFLHIFFEIFIFLSERFRLKLNYRGKNVHGVFALHSMQQ